EARGDRWNFPGYVAGSTRRRRLCHSHPAYSSRRCDSHGPDPDEFPTDRVLPDYRSGARRRIGRLGDGRDRDGEFLLLAGVVPAYHPYTRAHPNMEWPSRGVEPGGAEDSRRGVRDSFFDPGNDALSAIAEA